MNAVDAVGPADEGEGLKPVGIPSGTLTTLHYRHGKLRDTLMAIGGSEVFPNAHHDARMRLGSAGLGAAEDPLDRSVSR